MTTSTDEKTLVAEIVASYVSNNTLPADELPELIRKVRAALDDASASAPAPESEDTPAEPEPAPEPAVPVEQSVSDEQIICLECGKPFRSLKRHLKSAHGLDEKAYRARFGLSRDYPLTAPAYSRARAETAKRIGLGRKPRKAEAKG